jgi:uncharacterized DUF497 family protein
MDEVVEMGGGEDPLVFEWHTEKAERNLAKHGISFHEAATVFGDPRAITFGDPDHSDDETRSLTLGRSDGGVVLMISHTEREGRIRLISRGGRAARRGRSTRAGDTCPAVLIRHPSRRINPA